MKITAAIIAAMVGAGSAVHAEPIALNCVIKNHTTYQTSMVIDLNKKTIAWGQDTLGVTASTDDKITFDGWRGHAIHITDGVIDRVDGHIDFIEKGPVNSEIDVGDCTIGKPLF